MARVAIPSPAGYPTAPPVETAYDEGQPGFITPANFPGSAQIDRANATGGAMPVTPTGGELRDSRQAFDALTKSQQLYVQNQLASGRPAIVQMPPTLRVPYGRDAAFLPVRTGNVVPQAAPPVPGTTALAFRMATPESAGLAPPVEAQDVNQSPAELVQYYNQQSALEGRRGGGMFLPGGQATNAPLGDNVAKATAASVNQQSAMQRARSMVQWAMRSAGWTRAE